MKYPFSTEQFLNVFRSYNNAVFPAQFLFYAIGILSVILLFTGFKLKDKIISSTLAFLWLWIGVVYHFLFFAQINKAAYFFAILFVVQGLIFVNYGWMKNKIEYKYRNNIYCNTGLVLIVYALIIYPLLGYYLGHRYPSNPTFGLPCPTAIFTFGILLFSTKKFSFVILIIPLFWSLIGFGAALNFTIYEDIGLLAAGIITRVLLSIKNKYYRETNSIKIS